MGNKALREPASSGVLPWAKNAVAYLLWAITAVVGLIEIFLMRQIAVTIYLSFTEKPGEATFAINLLGVVVVLLLALVWIVYVFGSLEGTFKRAGTKGIWNILLWAIAIELLILILYFVV